MYILYNTCKKRRKSTSPPSPPSPPSQMMTPKIGFQVGRVIHNHTHQLLDSIFGFQGYFTRVHGPPTGLSIPIITTTAPNKPHAASTPEVKPVQLFLQRCNSLVVVKEERGGESPGFLGGGVRPTLRQ